MEWIYSEIWHTGRESNLFYKLSGVVARLELQSSVLIEASGMTRHRG
jgi:hypothetical protein